MKKSMIALMVATLVLMSMILWILNSQWVGHLAEMVSFGVIIILVGFGFFIGIQRLRSVKKGEPAEDELSKSIMRKASSLSYYISIYLWLVIMYFSDRLTMESHTQIGMGILGMAIVFFISWVVIKLTGPGYE